MAGSRTTTDRAFQAIVIDDEGRVCADIPESACEQESGNFFKHVGALALTKGADGLVDPKLVLALMAGMSGLAIVAASGLDEVQRGGRSSIQ